MKIGHKPILYPALEKYNKKLFIFDMEFSQTNAVPAQGILPQSGHHAKSQRMDKQMEKNLMDQNVEIG
jgi:hypothetical protein